MRRAIWMALAFMGTAPLVALAQQNTGAAPAASPSGAASIDRGQDTTAQQAPGSPGQQPAGSIGTTQGQPATGGGGVQGTGDGQGGGTGGAGAGTAGVGTTGPTSQQAPASTGTEAMQRELTTLRQRVSRLEAEVGALRGTGGGGTGGATPGVDTGTPGPDPEDMKVQGPVAVATAVFDGKVVDVTRKHIDIVDSSDGTFYRLTLDDQTRAFVGPDLKRIPVEQLSEGTTVRTSFALISGEEHARYIVTQPQRQQGQQQQRQERRGAPPQRTPQR